MMSVRPLGHILLLALLTQTGAATADSSPDSQSNGSLFDRLFVDETSGEPSHRLPYPFSQLVQSIEQHLGRSINDDPNRVDSAMFPVSRCINRYSAGPDYYLSPRLVVSVDSEHMGTDIKPAPYLKDRLYLGYQPSTESMEVISYNPSAGRFDFQLVTQYNEDQTPTVINADRDSCTSCHQNEGPIFPRALWSETDNNPRILNRIAAARGIPEDDIPRTTNSRLADIDGSINRANMFSLFQRIWKQGCRSDSVRDSFQCRAGLLESALQHRLDPTFRLQTSSHLVHDYLLPILIGNIQQRWPDGIAVPSSDIRDQNPIRVGIEQHLASAETLKQANDLRIQWQPDNIQRIVRGLGQFVSLNNIIKLDRQLHAAGVAAGAQKTREGECYLRRVDKLNLNTSSAAKSGDVSLRCRWAGDSFSEEMSFFADLFIENGVVRSLPFMNRMTLGSKGFVVGLTHRGASIENIGPRSEVRFDLFNSRNQVRGRLPNGEIIDSIAINWGGGLFDQSVIISSQGVRGKATLTTLSDQRLLERALQIIVENSTSAKSELLGEVAFDGDRLMDAVFAALESISP